MTKYKNFYTQAEKSINLLYQNIFS